LYYCLFAQKIALPFDYFAKWGKTDLYPLSDQLLCKRIILRIDLTPELPLDFKLEKDSVN